MRIMGRKGRRPARRRRYGKGEAFAQVGANWSRDCSYSRHGMTKSRSASKPSTCREAPASPRYGCNLQESRWLWTAPKKWRETERRRPCTQKCTQTGDDASPLVNPKKTSAIRRRHEFRRILATYARVWKRSAARGHRGEGMTADTNFIRTAEKRSAALYRPGSLRRPVTGAQSGQTIVELALILPLLLMLVLGVTEIGRYAYYDILVANAARAGAAYGAQGMAQAADNNGIQAAAKADGLSTMTITPLQQCGCSAAGLGGCPSGAVCPLPLVYIQVTATENFVSLFHYPGLPPNMTLTSTVTMRVSQ